MYNYITHLLLLIHMSKKIQIIIIVWLIFAIGLSSRTIFHGKWSSLTTSLYRQPKTTLSIKKASNVLHTSYKWLQWTQRSPSKSDQLQQIIAQE